MKQLNRSRRSLRRSTGDRRSLHHLPRTADPAVRAELAVIADRRRAASSGASALDPLA